jgi:DNA replication protein DnaC
VSDRTATTTARPDGVSLPAASGTGKTHIALGLALAACQKGLSVGFTTAAALVHELIEARDEKRLLRLQRQLAGYKLLVIDELGYVPLSQAGAELLFEVFSQRYERNSTIVTSNLPFDEWTGVFASERLAGALPSLRKRNQNRRYGKSGGEPHSRALPGSAAAGLPASRAQMHRPHEPDRAALDRYR